MSSRARGVILAQEADGDVVASGAVTFFAEDGVSAFGQSLYDVDTGGSPVSTHTTSSIGYLTRFAPFSQRGTFKVNGGQTFPIDFEVDPADVAAFDPTDNLTLTRGYRTVARMRVAAIEAKVRDAGGLVQHVDYHAGGVVINDGVGDPTPAISAAITALGGLPGVIQFGPGTYLAPSAAVVWPSNVVIRGAGVGVTTLKHRDASSQGVIILRLDAVTNGVVVRDLTIDGNRANNQDYDSAEVSLEVPYTVGANSDCAVINVEFKNHNKLGVAYGGNRPVIANCRFNGGATDPYANLATFPARYGGLIGAVASGLTITTDPLVTECYFFGYRSAGLINGGVNSITTDCHFRDCHRADFPAGTPGSPIAPDYTATALGASLQPPTNVVIVGCTVYGATYNNNSNNGIELDSVQGALLADCAFEDQHGIGIKIASSGGPCSDIRVQNCIVKSINGVTASAPSLGGSVAVFIANNAVYPIRGVVVSGMVVRDCHYILYTGGDVGSYALYDWILTNNTNGWEKADAAETWNSDLHTMVSGAIMPIRRRVNQAPSGANSPNDYAAVYINAHASGNGLWVQGAADGSHYALRVGNNAGATLWYIVGNGQVISQASAGPNLSLDTIVTTAAIRSLLAFQESGSTKGAIGLDAVDVLAVLNAGATAVLTKFPTAANPFSVVGAAFGQSLNVKVLEEQTTIAAAATTDTTILLPAEAIILAVPVRVTTVIPTAATFTVGDSGSAARFNTGANVSTALNTTNAGTKAGAYYNATATAVRLTPNLTPAANTGRVRVTIYYLDCTPPTS